MNEKPDYCPCEFEAPDPCPACGATNSGNDQVKGICQARYCGKPYDLELSVILTDKNNIDNNH